MRETTTCFSRFNRQNFNFYIFRPAFLISAIFIFITVGLVAEAFSQKSGTIVIHDTTSASNGGENATQGLRDRLTATLEREKPCVEALSDQDLRDALNDEREREMLEGTDNDDAIKAIGTRFNSRLVVTVKALPGAGGTTVYSAFVIDTVANRTISRQIGGENEVADAVYKDIAGSLADTCKQHWIGTVKWVYSQNEEKTTRDSGAAHAARRNVRRENKQTSQMETKITANLLAPAAGESINSPKARVAHRTIFNATKSSTTSGENLCREPNKNPYYKGFSEEYSETIKQVGRGTDTMPVFIEIADDGRYTIKVAAPGGILIGKIETRSSHATCGDSNPKPSIEAQEIPDGKLMGTSFEVEGRMDPKNRSSLSGTKTLPDGKTTISWNLRLVKPKGK